MLIVQCGCSFVVENIDDGRSEMTFVGGALCKHCFANDGDYAKSPYWKEVNLAETKSSASHSESENSGGMVVRFPDKQVVSKKVVRRQEKAGRLAQRA